MAKKPLNDNPVRLVRKALGNTQPEFARQLGISESFLQKIELGVKKLPIELAELMMVRFGVRADSLMSEHGKPDALFDCRPGTLTEKMAYWQNCVLRLNEDAYANFRENLSQKLDALFEAASRGNNALVLGVYLDRWIAEQERVLGLKLYRKAVLAEREAEGRPVDWTPYIELETLQDGTLRFRAMVSSLDPRTSDANQPAATSNPTPKRAARDAAPASRAPQAGGKALSSRRKKGAPAPRQRA